MPVGQGGVRGRLLRVTVADRLGVVDAPIVPDEGLNQEPSDASRYNQTPADTIRRQQVQQIRCTQEHASRRWADGLSWPQVPISAPILLIEDGMHRNQSQSVTINHNQGAHLTYRRWHASQSVTISRNQSQSRCPSYLSKMAESGVSMVTAIGSFRASTRLMYSRGNQRPAGRWCPSIIILYWPGIHGRRKY